MLFLQCLPKTKGNAKKANRVSSSAPVMKQAKKTVKHSQVPETLAQYNVPGANRKWRRMPTEDEVFTTTQEAMAQKMDAMMEMLLDLSHNLKASEIQ